MASDGRDGVCQTPPRRARWVPAVFATILALVLAGGGLVGTGVADALPSVGSSSTAVPTDYSYDSVGKVGAANTTSVAARAAHQLALSGKRCGPSVSVVAAEAAGGPANAVIGKVGDLNAPGAIGDNEYTLLDQLPDQGSPHANWSQNSGVLRQEMGRGVPIRDASIL